MQKYFGGKVQKISINAGATCPNRDGTVGRGGCTYCNNRAFSPEYCTPQKSITAQLEEGKRFFARKSPSMRYLAYFQSYTNTYGPLEVLRARFEEALSVDSVLGLVIATRPDCMTPDLYDYLAALSHSAFVMLEFGIESTCDRTLKRINRGHDFATACLAIREAAARGILVGGHVILGLPGETREEILAQAPTLSALPLDVLKLHQLQLIKGTAMAEEFRNAPEPFHFYSVDEYIDLVVDYLQLLRPTIAVERFTAQSPKELLVAPDWGLKNYEFVEKLKRRMRQLGVRQGDKCVTAPYI